MAVIYVCPADKRFACSWAGYASELKDHFEKNHPDSFSTTHTIELDVCNNDESRLLIYLHKEIYLLRSALENGIVWIKLHYLGSPLLATKKQYNIFISPPVNHFQDFPDDDDYSPINGQTTNGASPLMFQSCISRTNDGWEINVNKVEELHGDKITRVSCSVQIEESSKGINIIRHNSSIRMKKHSFINDEPIIKDLKYLDRKISMLKMRKQTSFDIMDDISHLNFDMLETSSPKSNKQTTFDVEEELEEEEEEDYNHLFDLPEEIDLNCSTCSVVMVPPIYICNNGHNVCGMCRHVDCNVCRGFITNYRNEELEKISQKYKHPCRYAKHGCLEKLIYSNVHTHETECQYRPFKCHISECKFTGIYDKFITHLRLEHFSCKISETSVNPFPKNCQFYITNKKIGIFYCCSTEKDGRILWQVTACSNTEKTVFCELMFKGSKMKKANLFSKRENVYTFEKTVEELKKVKAKEKYAILSISV